MKRLAIVGGALLLALSGQGVAAEGVFVDGNFLLKSCEDRNSFCTGYIAAVSDLLDMNALADFVVCTPPKTTLRQLVDQTVKVLRALPTARTDPAAGLVVAALLDGWPCPKRR